MRIGTLLFAALLFVGVPVSLAQDQEVQAPNYTEWENTDSHDGHLNICEDNQKIPLVDKHYSPKSMGDERVEVMVVFDQNNNPWLLLYDISTGAIGSFYSHLFENGNRQGQQAKWNLVKSVTEDNQGELFTLTEEMYHLCG